jgi:hypothetical protein
MVECWFVFRMRIILYLLGRLRGCEAGIFKGLSFFICKGVLMRRNGVDCV